VFNGTSHQALASSCTHLRLAVARLQRLKERCAVQGARYQHHHIHGNESRALFDTANMRALTRGRRNRGITGALQKTRKPCESNKRPSYGTMVSIIDCNLHETKTHTVQKSQMYYPHGVALVSIHSRRRILSKKKKNPSS
jgi:hypothetical protein